MYEIVYRRYKKLRDTRSEFPDLIVVDGGELQLKFAKKALDELGINIAIVGLAKKLEEIYYPSKKMPIQHDKRLNAMKIIIQARDEAHRFGISYHRLLKSKKMLDNSE
jgi:excinuclease ABC subunit C